MSNEIKCNFCGMKLPSADILHDAQNCAEYLKDECDKLREEIVNLREQMRWIPVSEKLPVDGKSYLVYVKEFGLPSGTAVAKPFISSLHPDDPHWFLDRDFYHLDCNIQVAQNVTHYAELPIPPEEQ